MKLFGVTWAWKLYRIEGKIEVDIILYNVCRLSDNRYCLVVNGK